MKFAEVKSQILKEGKKVRLVSENSRSFTMEKREIRFEVADGKVFWTAYKEVHEESPVENSDMLFVSNATTKREGNMSVEEFKAITADEFAKVIQNTEEEVVSADGGEHHVPTEYNLLFS